MKIKRIGIHCKNTVNQHILLLDDNKRKKIINLIALNLRALNAPLCSGDTALITALKLVILIR